MRRTPKKIVAFDLDETLGCFVELGMFWDALEYTMKGNLSHKQFFEVMDMFPEFVRPNIYNILSFLKRKKRQGECEHVMIYTNNQGVRNWTEMIAAYFDMKMKSKLFDQIIAAFKVRGKVVEMRRTSHDKSVDDLLRCTQLPKGTKICFLDDQYHPLMEDETVYYINVKPFTHSIPFGIMAERYHANCNPDMEKNEFVSSVVSFMKMYSFTVTDKSSNEEEVDSIVGKQILVHLKEFFSSHSHIDDRSRKHNRKESNVRGTRRK
jgi:hypothetical protein